MASLTYLQLLDVKELIGIEASSDHAIDVQTAQTLQCPLCLYVSTEVIKHIDCDHLFCTSCVKNYLNYPDLGISYGGADNWDRRKDCPVCRQMWFMEGFDHHRQPTQLCRPTRLELKIIKGLNFQCPNCPITYSLEDIGNHRCCLETSGKFPSTSQTTRSESGYIVISNSGEFEIRSRPTNRNRLFTLRFEGKSIASYCFRKKLTAIMIKEKLATLAGVSPTDIELFKFSHQVLDDHDQVESFHQCSGRIILEGFKSKTINKNNLLSLRIQPASTSHEASEDAPF